jgi:hypothetical protein
VLGVGGGIVAGGGSAQLFKAIRPQTISCVYCFEYTGECHSANASVDVNGQTYINGVPGTARQYYTFPNCNMTAKVTLGGLSFSVFDKFTGTGICEAAWAP